MYLFPYYCFNFCCFFKLYYYFQAYTNGIGCKLNVADFFAIKVQKLSNIFPKDLHHS